jgi:hypothetical protein
MEAGVSDERHEKMLPLLIDPEQPDTVLTKNGFIFAEAGYACCAEFIVRACNAYNPPKEPT